MGGFFNSIGSALSDAWDWAGNAVSSSSAGSQKGDGIFGLDADLVNSIISIGGGLYSQSEGIKANEEAAKRDQLYALELEKAKLASGMAGGGGGGVDPRTLELKKRELQLQAYRNYMDSYAQGTQGITNSLSNLATVGQRALLGGK